MTHNSRICNKMTQDNYTPIKVEISFISAIYTYFYTQRFMF